MPNWWASDPHAAYYGGDAMGKSALRGYEVERRCVIYDFIYSYELSVKLHRSLAKLREVATEVAVLKC